MRTRRALAALAAGAVGMFLWWGSPTPSAADGPDRCLDPARPLDLGCIVGGTATHLVRVVCSTVWVDPLCERVALSDPGYATSVDPSPGAPLVQRVGAVHEHSGYSDGDPETIPADYFAAGRTGHNVADDGVSDTGVVLDFVWGSEHSDNGQLPVTTAAACLDPSTVPAGLAQLDLRKIVFPLQCEHLLENDHYWKWEATLRQAREATDEDFAAMRGFEWTNDYFNHMNVYFSTNVRNAKIDGSYLTMGALWRWLRTPVARGGGADGLLTFNHPGGQPALSPFDGGLPHNELLHRIPGGGNWNGLAYVDAEIDDRVVGMEVNDGEDLSWFVEALANGWHIGPVAAEDEHQREWSSSADNKTLIHTGGTSPQDYYWAFANRRTVAVHDELVGGSPGTRAEVPTIELWADGADINAAGASPLGSRVTTGGDHTLHLAVAGSPIELTAVLVSSDGGQDAPIPLGTSVGGALSASHEVTAPAVGEGWYFAVLCPAANDECGSDDGYVALTAPLWFSTGPANRPSQPAGIPIVDFLRTLLSLS